MLPGCSFSDFHKIIDVVKALEEIESSLRQMLLLAELSASDIDVDHSSLQAVLERLRNKINRLADQL